MLIQCKDCNHQYSNKSEKCPNCGSPNEELLRMSQIVQYQQKKYNNVKKRIDYYTESFWKNICFIFIVIAIIVGLYLIGTQTGDNQINPSIDGFIKSFFNSSSISSIGILLIIVWMKIFHSPTITEKMVISQLLNI